MVGTSPQVLIRFSGPETRLELVNFDLKISTVKSRAVDRSTIQFLTFFWVLLSKMCYYLRRATIAMSSNQSTDELHEFISMFVNYMVLKD